MKTKSKSKQIVKYTIKRKTSKPLSSQEHVLSEGIKAFRRTAHRMNPGDSIECTNAERRRIMNYLRFRKISSNFKSRNVSKKKDIVAIYCIKKTNKSQLV